MTAAPSAVGATILVSLTVDGTQNQGTGYLGDVSGDGRFVALSGGIPDAGLEEREGSFV